MRINLVQGQSAGGLLRQACRQFGVPGSVCVIGDDLSIGPLCSDDNRDDWWEGVWKAAFGEAYRPSVYKQWKNLAGGIRDQKIEEVVLWSSESARDYVLDRMTASIFADYSGLVSRIAVPPRGALHGVGLFPPDRLAAHERTKQELGRDIRARLATDFDNLLRNTTGIRRLEDGVIRSLPDDGLDQSIFESCPFEWTKWTRVIGMLMTECDGQNLLAGYFFEWRLHCLAEAGKIELQGSPEFGDWSNVSVRRSSAAS